MGDEKVGKFLMSLSDRDLLLLIATILFKELTKESRNNIIRFIKAK